MDSLHAKKGVHGAPQLLFYSAKAYVKSGAAAPRAMDNRSRVTWAFLPPWGEVKRKTDRTGSRKDDRADRSITYRWLAGLIGRLFSARIKPKAGGYGRDSSALTEGG
jgi:hypothetical protein